ncbi:MAG: BON domain-containing protein [Nevskia sp.]|nr:BON domain-containing protein [Nevskia sp.]
MNMKPRSLAVKGGLAAVVVAMLSACAGQECTPDQAATTNTTEQSGEAAAMAPAAAPAAAAAETPAAPAASADTSVPAAGGAPAASPAVPPPDYNAPPPAEPVAVQPGPADVTLPDNDVTAKVKSALASHSPTRGLRIQVSTGNGVVRLTGVVSSSVQIDQVVSVVSEVEGVREVNNLLKVGGK